MAWHNDREFVQGLFSALVDSGYLTDIEEAKKFMRQPYKYEAEYKAWAARSYPTDEDEDWDEFVGDLQEMQQQDVQEEDEEEEEESEESEEEQ